VAARAAARVTATAAPLTRCNAGYTATIIVGAAVTNSYCYHILNVVLEVYIIVLITTLTGCDAGYVWVAALDEGSALLWSEHVNKVEALQQQQQQQQQHC
jgi:hypothetical protein